MAKVGYFYIVGVRTKVYFFFLINYPAGIDHSPLVEHRPGSSYLFPSAICLSYKVNCRGVVPPGLFFRKTQVRVGSTMTVSLPPETAAPILPRDVAKGVPFGDMGDVLARFDISPSSAEAATLAYTVRECQAPTLAGELSSCTTSVEDTVQSAMHMLGTTQGVWAAASSTLTSAGLPHELYAVETVTPLDGGRHVGCHEMPYPYAVFQCHMMNEPSKAYMMSLRSLHGGPTTVMAALCHLDTSKWDPDHVAFKILHTQPGDMPVCHFMPYAHLLFGIGKN